MRGAAWTLMAASILTLVVGTIVFSRALLSKRDILTNRTAEACFPSDANFPQVGDKIVDEVVLVLIDAMRPDFAVPSLSNVMVGGSRCSDDVVSHANARPVDPVRDAGEGRSQPPGPLTYIEEALSLARGSYAHGGHQSPRQPALGMFLVADAPTTTSQRLKAITTGTLPAFVEAGSNFNSDLVEEDNLIWSLGDRGRNAAAAAGQTKDSSSRRPEGPVVLGDDTWTSLYDTSRWNEATVFPSFDVRDLDSNDEGVLSHLYRALGDEEANANLLVAHFLGVDHAGHRYHAADAELHNRLSKMNVVLRNVSRRLDERTAADGKTRLMISFGDHGMSDSGDHGGASSQETDSFLFTEIFSRASGKSEPSGTVKEGKELLRKLLADREERCDALDGLCALWRCSPFTPQFEPGEAANAAPKYRPTGVTYQVDLAPTIAVLLGIPIPFSSIGRVIPEVIAHLAANGVPMPGGRSVSRTIEDAMKCNRRQLDGYFEASGLVHPDLAQKQGNRDSREDAAWSADEWAIATMAGYLRGQRSHIDLNGLVAGIVILTGIFFALLLRHFGTEGRNAVPPHAAWRQKYAVVLSFAAVISAFHSAVALVGEQLIAMGLVGGRTDPEDLWYAAVCLAILSVFCNLTVTGLVLVRPSPARIALLVFGVMFIRFGTVFANSYITKETDAVHFIFQTLVGLVVVYHVLNLSTRQHANATESKGKSSDEKKSASRLAIGKLRWSSLARLAAAIVIAKWLVAVSTRARMHGTHLVEARSILDEWMTTKIPSEVSSLAPFVCNLATIAACLGLHASRGGTRQVFKSMDALLAASLGVVFVALEGTVWMHWAPLIAMAALYLPRGFKSTMARDRVVVAVAACWWTSLAGSTSGARVATAASLVMASLIHRACLEVQCSGYLHAGVAHAAAWLAFFAGGHQCIASTIDWNAAFVGMQDYHMVVGGALVMCRTFGGFAVAGLFAGLAEESRTDTKLTSGSKGKDKAASITAGSCFFSHNLPQRLVFLAITQVFLSAVSIALQRQHLMLYAIFCPKFLADVGMALVGTVPGYLLGGSLLSQW